MTQQSLWKKIECGMLDGHPYHLACDDVCYYARERVSRGDFKKYETNQLIANFKKSPERRQNQFEWKHRTNAVHQFAREVALIFPADQEVCVASIPSSKVRTDPRYDSRFDDMFRVLKTLRPKLRVCEPIVRTTSIAAVHTSDEGRPRPHEVIQTLEWDDDYNDLAHLVLIDDVLTTGAHFKACQQLALDHIPGLQVIGVFWAKTIWTNDDE